MFTKPEFYHFPHFNVTFCSVVNLENPNELIVTYSICNDDDNDKYDKKVGREICMKNLEEGTRIMIFDLDIYKYQLQEFIRKPVLNNLMLNWTCATHEFIRRLVFHYIAAGSPLVKYWTYEKGYSYRVLKEPLRIDVETHFKLMDSDVKFID